jgi:signal transduction histidine kinase
LSASLLKLKLRGLPTALALTLLLSIVSLVLSFLLPALSSSHYYQDSLNLLRRDARRIKSEFAQAVSALDQKRASLAGASFPGAAKAAWTRLRDVPLNKDTEGVEYYDGEGRLTAWFGSVLDLEQLFKDKSAAFPPAGQKAFIVKSRASAYLVSVQDIPSGGRLAFFRLLAYDPQFKSPYLEEYQFLGRLLPPRGEVDYWDFREDVSGFEKIFARHQDEFIGQPRLKDEVQSLIFPLRLNPQHILATVSLNAPSQKAYVSSVKETWLFVFHLSFLVTLILMLSFLGWRFFSSPGPNVLLAAGFILSVLVFRIGIFSLSRLPAARSLPAFSPASSSFFSISFLTRSPADTFASAVCLLLVLLAVGHSVRRRVRERTRPAAIAPTVLAGAAASFLSLEFSLLLERFMAALVMNTNLNLLKFSFSASFLFLLLSVFALLLSVFYVVWLMLGSAAALRPGKWPAPVSFLAGAVVFVAFQPHLDLAALVLVWAPVLITLVPASRPRVLSLARARFAGLCLAALWIVFSLNLHTGHRNKDLLQESLKNTILSQEVWADFFLEGSFPELERQSPALLAGLKKPADPDLAHNLWEKTLLARFNWYSSLEILDPEGAVLSRFSLNLPKIFQPSAAPSPSRDWSLYHTTMTSLGKEKDFLVAYKDWFEGESYRGRTILSASLDFEMLPFLYSANPYFELLRAHSLPSLQPFDVRFAVFDPEGQIVFNPYKVTSGLPADLVTRIQASPAGVWSRWADKEARFRGFFFAAGKRFYALLLPVKGVVSYAVEFLRLFFFGLAVLGLPLLLRTALFRRDRFRQYFWSFSNRVYAAFVAVALVPLLLFTFSTRSFFARIFSQQFADEAEIHANFARNVMEDYFYFQQEERRTPQAPPEDLVLWISTTIGNDVNLYQDGRLVYSSRAEFFDSGLLPELIDGETYYSLVAVRNPLATQRRTIGDFSFHTLTIPYSRADSLFLISLPFPFEQQDISAATAVLLEFLIFLFAFVLALVVVFARGIRTMIVAPIRKLLAATREAGRGNLDIALDYKPNDEMKILMDGFNAMVRNLKQHQRDLAEMSQKAAWAEMARKVAHEIKNPLTPIQLSAEHLLRVYADRRGDFERALKESAAYIISEVENLRKIAQEFLESSREAPLHKELVDLREVIQETLAPYKNMLSDRIAIHETYEGLQPIYLGDRSRLKMAVRNIIINAIESIQGPGEIRLSVRRSEGVLTVEVQDTGPGMAPEVLQRIFEPQFSTKAAGAGLGLPIAKKIIEDHGGSIRIESRPGRGTAVFLLLPAA